MRLLYTSVVLLFSCLAFAQQDFNLELVSQVNYPEGGNDIWGWVADNGTEYAIVGTVDNTRIYDLADPSTPREIATIPGSNTVWRDMKSFEDHVYVTADNSPDGLLVIDMSQVSEGDSIRYQYLKPAVESSTGSHILGSCHNLYIDTDDGYCYLAGCGNQSEAMNKAIIFDLNQDKWNPTIVGVHGGSNDEYAHDLYVKDNIMYSSEIYEGALAIYDVTDKANIVLLGDAPTSFDFTHNAWISDDGDYVFTTDERGNAFVDAYDISNFDDIQRLDQFQPLENAGQGVVPHNAHYHEGYLVTSWYTEGVVITDVSRPSNMIKVGSYDTFFGNNGGTNGCWGAYPYLPSGLVLANDRDNGLHVLRPAYTRACWLEGNVTLANDGSPINNVTVTILTDEANEGLSDIQGAYKTGIATPGTYTVVFTHPTYGSQELEVSLVNGELTLVDVQFSIPPITLSGTFVDAITGSVIETGVLRATTEDRVLDIKGQSDGTFGFNVYDESHSVVAGAWGYMHRELEYTPDGNELVIELMPGYMDDFVLDQGWKIAGDAPRGIWERGVPVRTLFQNRISNISEDVQGDLGDMCYITGNGGGSAGDDDVDNGSTILSTPNMNLVDLYENPEIRFKAYFFNAGGSTTPDDKLDITLNDGTSFYFYGDISDNLDGWSDDIVINPGDLGISDLSQLSLNVAAADVGEGHLLEAAVDVFRVQEAVPSNTYDRTGVLIAKVFPNPATDILNIEAEQGEITGVKLYTMDGKMVLNTPYSSQISVETYDEGIYLLELQRVSGEKLTTRLMIK